MKNAYRRVSVTLITLLIPRAAWADDCSGLTDCWDQILTALLVLAAIVLLVVIAWEVVAGGLLAEGAIAGAEALEAEAVAAEVTEVGEAEATAASGLTPEEMMEEAEREARGRELAEIDRQIRLWDAEEKLDFDLKAINRVGGQWNCPDTSVAVEANLRGAERVATTTEQVLTNKELEAVLGRTFEPAESFAEIETKLEQLGPGARGIVRTEPLNGDIGHVFNVVNVDGEVIFIDGQQGLASANPGDLIGDSSWVTDFMQTWPP